MTATLLGATPSLASIITTWTASAGGPFGSGANWSHGVPGPVDTALFSLDASYVVTNDKESGAGRLIVRGGDVTLDLSSSLATFSTSALLPALVVGESSREIATLRLVGTEWLSAPFVHVADSPTASGTLTIGMSTSLVVEDLLHVGRRGAGHLDLDGGTVSARRLTIGTLATAVATASLDDGTLGVDETLIVGQFGEGTLLLANGSMVIADEMILGLQYSSTATLRLESGSHMLLGGPVDLGLGGNVVVEILDGSTLTANGAFVSIATLPASIFVPPFEPSSGTVRIDGAGSTLAASGDLYVPLNGNGELDLSNGGRLLVGGDLVIGQPTQASIRLEFSGPFTPAAIDISGLMRSDEPGAAPLLVELAAGFLPALGDQFELITAAEFALPIDTTLPSLPGGLVWLLATVDESGRETLRATIGFDADLNGDGMIDGADLGLLLNAWGDSGSADLNGDGVVDGADIGLLLQAWS